jgi:hypothetical protein
MLYDFFYVWPKAHKMSETGRAIGGGCGYSTNRKSDWENIFLYTMFV